LTNTNCDKWSIFILFLVGVEISFITLNDLSHTAVEITYVSTALNSCWSVCGTVNIGLL